MDWVDALKAIIPTAVIVAALIAGSVAFIGHFISRGNARLAAEISRKNAKLTASLEAGKQLAAFRQEWLDCIRDDMAKFAALHIASKNEKSLEKEFNEIGTRIELRMNPKDPEFDDLVAAMARLTNAESEFVGGAHQIYMRVCQSILKREWDVLKGDIKKLDNNG